MNRRHLIGVDADMTTSTSPLLDGKAGASTAPLAPHARAAGVLVVLLNQVLNCFSGELMQYQESGGGAAGFDKPFFSVWFNHSFTGLLSFVAAFVILQCADRDDGARGGVAGRMEGCLRAAGYSAGGDTLLSRLSRAGLGSASRSALASRPALPAVRAALVDASLLIVVYKFNVFWAVAIAHTSVSVFMAVSNAGCVFTFLLSWLFLRERATRGKLGAVGLCLGGVAAVAVSSTRAQSGSDHTHTSAAGLSWTVACTVGAAAYGVAWRLTPPGIGGGGSSGSLRRATHRPRQSQTYRQRNRKFMSN